VCDLTDALQRLKAHSRTLIAPETARRVSACWIQHFGVKLESFRFHAAKRANDHVQEYNTVFFAYDPVSIPHDHLIAMLAN
jgi:hypothetical protein